MDISQLVYSGFDFCAIVINLVILINYFIRKRLNTRTAKLYQALCITALISSVINLCLVLILTVFKALSPLWLVYIFNLMDYIAFNATGLVFLCYAVSVIYENKHMPKSVCWVVGAMILFNLAIIVFCGVLGFMQKSNDIVMVKILRYLVYGCRLAALGAALVYLLKNVRLMHSLQKINSFFFIAFNIAAALVQLFVSRIQISDFALSVAVLIIYISLQRPEDEIDEVTGMFNAKTFKRRVEWLLTTKQHLLVFIAELNNISVINAALGMVAGNKVVHEAAARLKAAIGKALYLYRLDGVKFAIVFNNEYEYASFKKDYMHIFDQPIEVNGTPVQVTALSCLIRCPEVTEKVSDIEDIFKYYRANSASSEDVIEASGESIEKMQRYDRVDYAIQSAIKHRAFKIYYQPIYSVKEKKFNCCEALIRLIDPELGFIPPDEFIPIAEQTGRIVEVGRLVIEEVCKFLTEEKPEKYGLEFVDVNLSIIQCMHPEIIKDIEDILDEYNVPRSMVNLEITETASSKSYALLQSRLNELHSNGFTISLDDFGTGFSSVEFLINFPFDVVKLDKSLVWAYMSTKKYEPILKHYMPMLHGIGAEIVAEGVETYEMVTALEELGCDYLQGFYYSRPVPKDQFIEFMIKQTQTQIA